MDFTVRVLAFVAGGSILLFLLVVYLQALLAAIIQGEDAEYIAPIQVIDSSEVNTALGEPLAQMLLVRIGHIRDQLTVAATAIQSVPQVQVAYSAGELVRPVEETSPPIAPLKDELPHRLQQSFTVDLKVGGVELTGMANWLIRQFSSVSLMRIIIETVGDKTFVYGNFDSRGQQTFAFSLPDKSSKDDILLAVARRIAQRSISRSIPELGAFTPEDFAHLLEVLSNLADLNRRIARGYQPSDEFEKAFATLDGLVRQVPRWSSLARITGEVAERANKMGRARDLYMQAMVHAQPKEEKGDLQEKIERVTSAIAKQTPAPPKEILKRLFSQMNIPEKTPMPRPIRIAVVGGAPTAEIMSRYVARLIARQREVQPISEEYKQNGGIENYFSRIISTISLVAPKAEFLVSQRPMNPFTEVVAATKELIDEKPEILLLPIRGFSQSLNDLFEVALKQNIVVILPAGNEGPTTPVPLAGDSLLDRVMVVSAVTETGNPAAFSQRDKRSFWVPGTDVPTLDPAGTWTRWNGTGPASAVAAGAIARILAEKPGALVLDLLQALRDSAHQIGSNPPVINVKASLDLL
jgi:hypothetical protein